MTKQCQREKSTAQLSREMWDAIPLAWIGSSIGVFMIISAVFWRLVMRPWETLMGEQGSRTIWRNLASNELHHGWYPPEIPMSANLIPLACALIGAALIAVTSAPWRAAGRELDRRKREAGR